MLLNYPSVFLNTYDASNPKQISTTDSDSHLITRNIDYYFIQFSGANSFELFSIDTIIPLEQVRQGKQYIVLDNSDEYFYDVVDSIYANIVNKFNIPAEQIILMSGAPCIVDYVKQTSLPPIQVEWVSTCEHAIKQSYEWLYKNDYPRTLEHKVYTKKYLLFNRRWRPWRPMLATLLYDLGLLEQGYISLGQADGTNGWNTMYNSLYRCFNFKDILDKNTSIQRLPPLYLDTEDLITNRVGLSKTTDTYFEDSYFSVITETTYFNNQPIFPTEKIFKAIAMRHPFILVTVPGTLKFLQENGYKTFNGIINESYDIELDDTDRLMLIAKEIERLCNLDAEDLSKFLTQAKEICEYNFQRLMTNNVFLKRMYAS